MSAVFEIECHCGNQRLNASRAPESITRCNCSICHRLGALWAYYDSSEIEIEIGEAREASHRYSWGEKSISYHRCAVCGCTTHYSMAENDGRTLVALNCRMAPRQAVDGVPLRDFDGLDTWKYL